MVVLVNGDTASAAEVLAGASRTTAGRPSSAKPPSARAARKSCSKLPKAGGGVPTGGMQLTVARFFSPKGQPYSGRGITPHILIDDAMPQSQSDMPRMSDPYHERAVQELDRLLAAGK